MTGEITLRGRVLPVGGIREKVLGAYRAGIKTILIPQRNLQDVDEIPAHVREHLEIIAVDSIDQVLHVVLGESPVSTTPHWRIA
jgi:ATP-dependent Lon protease